MTDAARRNPTGALALCVALLLPACKSAEVIPKIPGLEPYRITIQQGNYISQEMVAQLKLGMTREQVRFVLGTPLLQDVFHADRWDYVFYRETPDRKREQRNLSVVFEKDRLARVIGDLVPPEGASPQPTGFVPQIKPAAPKPAAETAKPAAETAKPAAEPARPGFDLARPSVESAKPAAEPAKPAAAAEPAETTQNWRAASDEPADKPEPAAAKPAEEAKKPEERKTEETKTEETKAEEPARERGWFGRMLEKIGL
ncbi:MAG: outer membrane protein assembly factor BamE [Burkholderiales bacterium]|nr:outer membrane protein assembly factor BamE [Burkholderiales bacterium]